MGRSRAEQQVYEDLMARYGRSLAEAFFRALDDLRAQAEVQRVIAAYQAGDIEGALDALHIDPSAFAELPEQIRQAYAEAGRLTAQGFPRRRPDGTALVVRFDGSNPAAERWLTEHSSGLVTRITSEQRDAVRDRLVVGMQKGQNPRAVALDIVGRVNRVTGKREGGILGLSGPQVGFVERARVELSDPETMTQFLDRTRRDKRFDRTIVKAAREGAPLPAAMQEKIITAYSRRLLQLRGEIIGRTEALTSMNAASYQAMRQVAEDGKVAASAIRRVWRSARDRRVRHSHAALDGDVVGLEEVFTAPSGARLLFPGDTSHGAPASETIGCRCIVSARIDWFANLA
jgi:hypothetical protein